jgi:hypothetical protein
MKRTEDEYYIESKRIRNEVLLMAETLKEHPMRFTITNGITMEVEITKSDLKTVLSKNVRNNKFNAIKNALAKDIRGYLLLHSSANGTVKVEARGSIVARQHAPRDKHLARMLLIVDKRSILCPVDAGPQGTILQDSRLGRTLSRHQQQAKQCQ